MNLPQYIWKRVAKVGHMHYNREKVETIIKMHNSEPAQFSEKCLDSYTINWFIQNTDIFFPKFKSIFIDKRDEDLFRQID